MADNQQYRPKGESEEWWKKDPVPRYQKELMEMGLLTESDISRLEETIKDEIEQATQAALEVPKMSYEDHAATAIDEL